MTTVQAFLSAAAGERDRVVLAHRPTHPPHDPWQHQGVLLEDERTADGTIVKVATVFLTGRECPWHCVMCDLWRYTIQSDTPRGALPHQLDRALESVRRETPPVQHLKLYNAGSFFDPRAVPEEDYDDIANRVGGFEHVVVESHPALIGPRLTRWREALDRADGRTGGPSLEVALGLETSHPEALHLLHKRFSLDQFRKAADEVYRRGASLRIFLLVGVPFIPAAEQQEWVVRSVRFAESCGASAVSLIPTRPGNGVMEALSAAGLFRPPSLCDVEHALESALDCTRARVFADLWNVSALAGCDDCFDVRRERLRLMNLQQRVIPAVQCDRCGGRNRS